MPLLLAMNSSCGATGGAELARQNPFVGGEEAATPGLEPPTLLGKSPVALRAAGLCILGRLGESLLPVGGLVACFKKISFKFHSKLINSEHFKNAYICRNHQPQSIKIFSKLN